MNKKDDMEFDIGTKYVVDRKKSCVKSALLGVIVTAGATICNAVIGEWLTMIAWSSATMFAISNYCTEKYDSSMAVKWEREVKENLRLHKEIARLRGIIDTFVKDSRIDEAK